MSSDVFTSFFFGVGFVVGGDDDDDDDDDDDGGGGGVLNTNSLKAKCKAIPFPSHRSGLNTEN